MRHIRTTFPRPRIKRSKDLLLSYFLSIPFQIVHLEISVHRSHCLVVYDQILEIAI